MVTDELEKVLKWTVPAIKLREIKVAEAIAKITAKIEKKQKATWKSSKAKETNGTFC